MIRIFTCILCIAGLYVTYSQCTKIYPMVLRSLSPLSPPYFAVFPHVLELSGCPPVPNPILESHERQSFSLLVTIPILALQIPRQHELNPSLLHLNCREAWPPISVCHMFRPSEVARYCPSAISEYREIAVLLMIIKLICCLLFIPRQIFEKGLFQ